MPEMELGKPNEEKDKLRGGSKLEVIFYILLKELGHSKL